MSRDSTAEPPAKSRTLSVALGLGLFLLLLALLVLSAGFDASKFIYVDF
jgi:hypothetical protein